jgi:hypothetical protein
MSRLRALLSLSLCLVLILSVAGPSPAQDKVDISEFNSGDIDFRTYSYLQLAKPLALPFVFFPGDGVRAVYFRDKPDGSPGWTRRVEERGFNALAMEHVGSAVAITPPDDDILKLMEKGLYGVYQVGMATRPEFAVGHEMAAGLLLKARSQDEGVGRALILIDPIGPQRSQPMTTLTPRDLYEQRQDLPDHLWRKWGFGPREGKLRRGLDLSMAAAESLLSTYDGGQPAYWAGLLTEMQSGLEVREPIKLFDLPVLVVRTPAADKEQIAREEAVVAWMVERGMRVDRLDLTKDPILKNVSGLPWMGDLSDEVLERFFEWHSELDLPERTDGIGL